MKKSEISFAFYVSGGAGRLLKLLETNSIVINDTTLIVNDNAPNDALESLLMKRGIKYIGVNYMDLGLVSNEKNSHISKMLLEEFRECEIDYCFCFGSIILKGDLLSVYKNKIINFHPSVLPMFPGVKSIDQALDKNAPILGNTAHFIDEGTDTGPIIMQSIVHNKNYTNYEGILDLQIPMLEQIYHWIIDKRLSVIDNKVMIKGADYKQIIFYPKLEIN